jgi:Lrp/AsnC family transcriptional regulator
MDASDKKILDLLQINATLSLAEISRRVGLSKTPCWNRIKSLEEKGIITNRITVLDRKKIGLPIIIFLSISVSRHSYEWATRFLEIVQGSEEIIEVHRLTGTGADYMLKIVAQSIDEYDQFQQKLIGQLEFTSMSSSVSLQELKHTYTLPLTAVEVTTSKT